MVGELRALTGGASVSPPRPVLVDTNVLVDILGNDPNWFAWSSATVSRCASDSATVINPLIYAEVSTGFASLEAFEEALSSGFWVRESLPWEAAFVAGKCFLEYRRRGGQKRSPLPDFYIGAHATVRGYRLLTRDPTRYRTYFPKLEILAP